MNEGHNVDHNCKLVYEPMTCSLNIGYDTSVNVRLLPHVGDKSFL